MNDAAYNQLTDQELLRRFHSDHNNEWLGALLERYTRLLYGVSMKYLKNPEEARDAVQQIFLKVITEIHKYEVSYFSSWLYMIAKNHCLMLLRRSPKIISVDELTEPRAQSQDPDPLQSENLLGALENALQHLNPEQQRCIRLFYLEKKSYQDISTGTGYNLLQVKSYIQNGKRNLRLLLEKNLEKLLD